MKKTSKPKSFVNALNAIVGTCASRTIVVVVKPGCPYCEATLGRLQKESIVHVVVPAASVKPEALESMAKTLGVATFPRVFVRGAFVGGNDKFQLVPTAELKRTNAPRSR